MAKQFSSRAARWIITSVLGLCATSIEHSACAGDWTITPRIAGQELFTDNVLFTPINRRSDLVTTVSPGIFVSDDSPRLQFRADYAPTFQLYALTPDLNFVGQNLYANGTGVIAPDLFFLDARAFLSVVPSIPGQGTGFSATSIPSLLGPTFINRSQGIPQSQLAQVSSFSASPYLARRFDGIGTAELRYSFTETNISGIQGVVSPLTPPGTALQNTSTTTNEGTAVFLTGENFGPFQSRITLDAADSGGTGAVTQNSQVIGVVDSAYAITQRIAALASIGHEQINFSGVPPVRIDDLIWGVGTRLTPNPDTTIELSYGHRNGFSAPNASLVYNITARTTLSASYTEGFSTVSQEIANNLAISDLNQFGQTVDSRTLLPLFISNPALGLQGGLFRNKLFNAAITTDLERDHFAIRISRSDNALVSQATPGSGTSQRSFQANASWSRDLSPRATAVLALGYSNLNFAAPTNASALGSTQETILIPSASLTYVLGPSLTGSATFYHYGQDSPQPQFRVVANVFMVNLRREF